MVYPLEYIRINGFHMDMYKIFYPVHEDVKEWQVSNLIELDLNRWRCDLIMTNFHREDTKAICRIPLSRRSVSDLVVWLQNKNGMYLIRSGYHVARKVMRKENWVESLRGPVGQQVWKNIWKLQVRNEIKVFGWRAYQDILPTCVNLVRRRIISDNVHQCCKRFPKSIIHKIWECG